MALSAQQRQSASFFGPGDIVSYLGSDPAPGAEFSEVVPGGKIWRLMAVSAVLVTSAFVANRRVRFTIEDGINIVEQLAAGAAHAASVTVRYSTANDSGAFGVNFHLPLPQGLLLGPGYRIRSSTDLLDVGDDWGRPSFLVQEIIF